MLTSRLHGTFVCLRCRLQRAGALCDRRALRFPSTLRSQPLAIQRHYAAGATKEKESELEGDVFERMWLEANPPRQINKRPAKPAEWEPLERLDLEIDSETQDLLKKEDPARRVIHAGKGASFLPGEKQMSIDVLGKAAHAIVLKRNDKPSSSRQAYIPEVAPEAIPPVDIASILKREHADPGLAETIKTIHEMKPQTVVVLETELEALKVALTQGFTREQLRSYVHFSRTILAGEGRSQLPAVVRQTWRAGQAFGATTSEAAAPSPESADDTSISKSDLVDLVLNDTWHLISQSKEFELGHLDVEFRDVEFELLMCGSNRWLREISGLFKDIPNQFELVPAQKVLRISAARGVAEAILTEINKVMELKQTVTHSVQLISGKPPSEAALVQVGKMTNSVVRLEPGNKQISIFWIEKYAAKDGTENIADVVLRLLLSAFGPKRQHTFVEAVTPETVSVGRYVVEHDRSTQMSWKDRKKQWARFVAPITKKSGSLQGGDMPPTVLEKLLSSEKRFNKAPKKSTSAKSATEGLTRETPDAVLTEGSEANIKTSEAPLAVETSTATTPQNLSSDESSHASSPSEKTKGPSSWSLDPLTATQAVFGHLLHTPTGISRGFPTGDSKLLKNMERAFVPVLPPLSGLQFGRYSQRDIPRHSTMLLRFQPDPDQDPELSQASPPLELRLQMDRTMLGKVISLRAVVDTFTANVMYPQRPFDVCVTQQRYYEMSGDHLHLGNPYAAAVAKFIQSSTFEKDGHPHTPSRLRNMAIPRRLLTNAKLRHSVPGTSHDDAANLVRVDYRFTGMENQRSVAAEYQGYTVRYSQGKGGQHGSHWSGLILDEASSSSKTSAAKAAGKTRDQEAEAFLSTVANLVSQNEGGILWAPARSARNLYS